MQRMSGAVQRMYTWAVRRPATALLIYWPIAFIGTHIPSPWERGEGSPDRLPLDKIGHFAGYALLAWLLTQALARRLPLAAAAGLAVLILAAYGGFDELTQPAFNRTADWPDWVADVIGATAGAAVAMWQVRRGRIAVTERTACPSQEAVAPGAGPSHGTKR